MSPCRRHLISLEDLSADELSQLAHDSARYADGIATPGPGPLAGALIGLYFGKTSTRTRTAFTAAAHRLGANVVAYGPHDLQVNTGETMADTGRVLASMLDGFVARTAGDPAELRTIAAQDTMSVINAMTSDEHPTQAIADLSTVLSIRGKLDGLRICYFGEGNNTAAALTLALARVPGAHLHLSTPAGYGVPGETLAAARRTATVHGARITASHDVRDLPDETDVIYTARWQTTGTTKQDPRWRKAFLPYRVTSELLDRWPAAIFMHDLPAHRGEEVDADVLDGPRSVAFLQTKQKLYGAMAVLAWTLGGVPR